MEKVKCTFKGCLNMGLPQQGYEFYICETCANEFERLTNMYASRKAVKELCERN